MTLNIINKYLVLFEAICFFKIFWHAIYLNLSPLYHQFSLKDISKTDIIAYKKEQL